MKHLKSYNESIEEEEISKEDYEKVVAILQSEIFDDLDIVRESDFDFPDYLCWGIAKNIWIGGINDVTTAKIFEKKINGLKPLIEEMTNITFEVKTGEYAGKIFDIHGKVSKEDISYVTIHLETIDSYSEPLNLNFEKFINKYESYSEDFFLGVSNQHYEELSKLLQSEVLDEFDIYEGSDGVCWKFSRNDWGDIVYMLIRPGVYISPENRTRDRQECIELSDKIYQVKDRIEDILDITFRIVVDGGRPDIGGVAFQANYVPSLSCITRNRSYKIIDSWIMITINK